MNSEERIEAAAKTYVNTTAPLGWDDFSPQTREWVKDGMQAALEAAGLNEMREALERLASSEAFVENRQATEEEQARMKFARAALTGDKSNG
jgi:hypothetical protein